MKARTYDPKASYLFVDGYNIINHWEDLRQISLISLEEARLDLADRLADYGHFRGTKIILVFDAHQVDKSRGSLLSYKGVEVVFTQERETADHYIEREVRRLDGRTQNILVATSDKLEQEMILAGGASRISARELEIEVAQAQGQVQTKLTDFKIRTQKQGTAWDPDILDQLKSIKDQLEED